MIEAKAQKLSKQINQDKKDYHKQLDKVKLHALQKADTTSGGKAMKHHLGQYKIAKEDYTSLKNSVRVKEVSNID